MHMAAQLNKHEPCLSTHFLHFSPSKRIQRNKMGQREPFSVGTWALPPRGWVPGHFTSPEGQGQENTNLGPGQASMTRLPIERGPILVPPWYGQVPGGRAEGLPSLRPGKSPRRTYMGDGQQFCC